MISSIDDRLLHDIQIHEAVDAGLIKIEPEPEEFQFQPATLDVRIGRTRIYSVEQSIWKGSESVDDLNRYAVDFVRSAEFPDKPDTVITLPPKSFAHVFLHETINLDPSYAMSVDLRSSRGRLGLCLATNKLSSSEGQYYMRVYNMNNIPIPIMSRTKFAQLFFHTSKPDIEAAGRIVTDPKRVEKLLPEFVSTQDIRANGQVVFRVGELMHIFKPMSAQPARTILQDYSQLYETRTLTDEGYILPASMPAIVQLTPALRVPNNVGIFLSYQHRSSGIKHRANAIWIDPRFEGHVTGHPYGFNEQIHLIEHMEFTLGTVVEYQTPVRNGYGSSVTKNHYLGSKGAVSQS